MSKPLAICIEDLDFQSEARYVRCVALVGRQPGLRLDEAGRVLWQSDDGVACELWVSADERLILYRPEGATRVVLHRAGRSLDVPCGKPVVVIDQDRLNVGARRLRIHVHGEAPSVAAPSPLPFRQSPLGRLAQAATAAAVIGAVVTTGGCIEVRETPPEIIEETVVRTVAPSPTIEVREEPPVPVEVVIVKLGEDSILEVIQGDWIAAQAYDLEGERVWISGTLTISDTFQIVSDRAVSDTTRGSYTFKPDRQVTGSSVEGYLDFLFDTPEGVLTLEYSNTVPYNPYYSLEDVLAKCVFRADSEASREFDIRLKDPDSLHFTDPSGEIGLWSITKQIQAAGTP